ncbi:MAG: DUF192 domain-containing protein [Candidatus Cloacimonetes bacterium]|nr:DUF192 domain-containing protein [Candidatus Cloacimonadota bacterium]
MRIAVSALMLLSCILLTAGCKRERQSTPDHSTPIAYTFRKDGVLIIRDANGKDKCQFDIEIADSPARTQQGLMFRETMADDQAMLFVFSFLDYHSFWMKNTYLPLDMIFIDNNQVIVDVRYNAVPFSEDNITPRELALFVLEVKAGVTQRNNIGIGDRIEWRRGD